MDISLGMVIPSLLLLTVLFIVVLGEGQNGCADILKCGEDGPDIRFPFRLKDRHPDNCSYPGFYLSCNEKNDTVLQLTNSVKASVNYIDYKSQLIQVSDPDNCLKIRNLSLSSSHFQFINEQDLCNFSLFKCTAGVSCYRTWKVDCLTSPGYQVCPLYSDDDMGDSPILPCTKMYSVSSVPCSIWESTFVEMKWSGPMCGQCEMKGKKCRLKNNSHEFETECFHLPKDNKGIVFYPIYFHFYNHTSSFSSQHALI